MNVPTSEEGDCPGKRGRGPRPAAAMIVAVVALLALSIAGLLGYGLAEKDSSPSDASAEAGFARDMQTHHNQAVQMALIIRPKTGDPVLQAVAYDIITSQQQQSGQMFAWLKLWGLPQTSPRPAMAWMTATTGDHDTGAMTGGTGQPPAATSGPDCSRWPAWQPRTIARSTSGAKPGAGAHNRACHWNKC